MTCTLGIDPGIEGAIAIMDGDKLVAIRDMPVVDCIVNRSHRRRVSHHGLSEMLSECGDATHVFVEEVSGDPKLGGGAAFNFGAGYGIILGILAVRLLPYTLVRPQAWQRAAGLGGPSMPKDVRKARSRARAAQLWPAHAGLFARVKDDGRAEAALIARYGCGAT